MEVEESPEFEAPSVLLVQFLHGGVRQQYSSDQQESVYTGKGVGHYGKQRVAEIRILVEI